MRRNSTERDRRVSGTGDELVDTDGRAQQVLVPRGCGDDPQKWFRPETWPSGRGWDGRGMQSHTESRSPAWPGAVVHDVRQLVAELSGCTPLVRLDVALAELGAEINEGVQVWGKLESVNPMGSIKDRAVLSMVRAAIERGDLAPGMRVVEATSGNTGLALAGVCAAWGMGCTLVCPDKVSDEKVSALRALGAEVVVCPATAAPGAASHYQVVAEKLGRRPGCWRPGQYENADNPASHRATAEEIWAQTDRSVTHVVAGVGTGGTLCGLAAAFERMGASVTMVCADPVGSSLSGGDGGGWLVEGIGEDEVPGNFDAGLVDGYVAVEDERSVAWCRKLAVGTGLWLGGSSGTAVAGAVQVAAGAPTGSVVVAVLADGGRAYLSKVYNDHWCAARGFSTGVGPPVWDLTAPDAVRGVVRSGGFSTGPVAGSSGRWVLSTDRSPSPRVGSVTGLVVDGRRFDPVFCGTGELRSAVVGRGEWVAVCDRGRVVAVVSDTELAR